MGGGGLEARGWRPVGWLVVAGLWLAAGLSAHAESADPSPSSEARIRQLEAKVAAAQDTLEGLRAELEALRRDAGMLPSVSALDGGDVVPADYVLGGSEIPLLRVEATPDAPGGGGGGGPAPTGELDEQTAPADQEPPAFVPAFLRDARALLLPRNRLEIEPGVALNEFNRNSLTIRGLDIINAIFIGTIQVQKLKRRSIVPSLQFRYGITDNIQMGVRVPGLDVYETLELPETVVVIPQRLTETKRTARGLGDVEGDLAWNFLHEDGWIPDAILTGLVKSNTGVGPFDLESNDEAATGSGFWGAKLGVNVVKVSDPATMFLNTGYFWHVAQTVNGVEIDPPDSIDIGAGLGYALNPWLSMTSSFNMRFLSDTRIGGETVTGSSAVVSTLTMGIAYGYSQIGSFQVSVGMGLTPDSPDFTVDVSLPFVFDLPKWWN